MQVHVLVYEHRHGTEVSAYSSEARAVQAAAAIAREWWEEARQRDKTLPQDPPSEDAEALSLYIEAQLGIESILIAAGEVDEGAAGKLDLERGGTGLAGDPYELRRQAERLIAEDRVPTEELRRLIAAFGGSEGSGEDVEGPYALVIAVEASSPEEAWEFVKNMLLGGIRWDRPLEVPYIGAPWRGIPEGTAEIATESISLVLTYSRGEALEHGVRSLTPCD